MPLLDEVLDELKGQGPAVEEQNTQVTEPEHETRQPEEQPEDKPEDKPAEQPEEKPEENPVDKPEDKPADKPEDKPAPKDTSKFSQQEKAEHAFRRQLSKQKERHDEELKKMQESFQKQLDDFKASFKKDEPVKTRADFPLDKGGDDAYIKYLTQKGVDEALAARYAKEEADRAEREKAEADEKEEREAQAELTNRFASNVRAAFKETAEYERFANSVNTALENGLGEVLDSVPTLRDFVFRNPDGPRALDRMLNDRDAFIRVMSQGDPTSMIIAAHDLAREAAAPAAAPSPAPAPVSKVPHLGKPGAGNTTAAVGDVFNSDKDLVDFVRKFSHRRR